MKTVNFVILEFLDSQKYGAELKLNRIYSGSLNEKNQTVEITDPGNRIDWIFWNNDTCIVLPDFFETIEKAKEFAFNFLPKEMDIVIVEKNSNFYIKNFDYKIVVNEEIRVSCKVLYLKTDGRTV